MTEKELQIKQLEYDLKNLKHEIDRKLKEERLEVYNVGKVHKKQVEFHRDPHRVKALFGGNRTGKTVAGAVEAVCHALGYSRFRKLEPSSGWVVSKDGDNQRKVTQAEILKWLPKNEILPNGIIVRHGRKDDLEGSLIEEIRLKNGQFIGFKTWEQGRESFQGASLGWVWFDEECPEDVFKECRMRIMDQRGDMWFTMTPLRGITWMYNYAVLNEKGNKNIADPWFMEWEDNPFLPKEEIAQMEADMEEEEREARQYGRFTSLCGFAFPELRKEIHIRKPLSKIPSWYKKFVTIDYGLDATAVLWIYVDNSGMARVYRAFKKSNLIVSEAAEAIKKHTHERIYDYLAPPDLWMRRNDTGKSAADIFFEHGVLLNKTSNDREAGWMNVHEWLKPIELRDEQTGEMYKTAMLTFDEGIDPELWGNLVKIQKDDKNPNDVATQPHNITHYPDSLRCFCINFPIKSIEPSTQLSGYYEEEELKDLGLNSYQRKKYMKKMPRPWEKG
ncbi:MAG: phage terminase large subunit [Caulobacteraceae bacterium]